MANITQRKNKDGQVSYRIRVFIDENADGKQKMKLHTWTPTPGMTPKQIEKELNRKRRFLKKKYTRGLCHWTVAPASKIMLLNGCRTLK